MTFASAGQRQVSVRLAAPEGTPLRVGTYDVVGALPPPGFPRIDLGVDGTACRVETGRFVVLEADLAPNGEVRRFVATFEALCQFDRSRITGEVILTGPFPLPPFQVVCLR